MSIQPETNEAIVKRLEALEQWLTRGDFVQVPPTPEAAPVATDAELRGLFKDQPMTWGQALRAAYNLGRQHGAAQPPFAADKVVINCPETCWVEVRRAADGKVLYDNFRRGTLTIPVGEPPAAPPAPAGGLVERVAEKMGPQSQAAMDAGELPYGAARAAIREVAAWLDRYGCHGCSLWLREEMDRA